MDKIDQYLIIIESFQLLLFSALLIIIPDRKSISKKIYALLFFLMLLVYANIGLFYLDLIKPATLLFYVFSAALLMIMPVFYFYIKSLTDGEVKVAKSIQFHFLPAMLIFFANTIIYLQLSQPEKQWFLENGFMELSEFLLIRWLSYISIAAGTVVLLIQFLFYSFLIIRKLREHQIKIGDFFSNFQRRRLIWIKFTVVLFFIIFLLSNFFYQPQYTDDVTVRIYFNLSIVILTFLMGIGGLRQIDIYDHPHQLAFVESKITVKDKLPQVGSKGNNHSAKLNKDGIVLTGFEKKEILDSLNRAMNRESLFLEPDLKIADVSAITNIPRKKISVAINEDMGTNFYHYVNRFRIEEAKALIKNDSKSLFSIEGIAKKSGFNSRSSFYTSFRKYTGMTPSEFREKVHD